MSNAPKTPTTMRKYKFRGKRADNGAWVYGDLIENQGRYFIYHATSETTIEDNDDSKITIIAVEFGTVGQFTGLLDRNGQEIYEGDILKGRTNKWRLECKPAPHDFIGYVQWEEQCDVGLSWMLTTLDSIGSSPLSWYVHCSAIDYSTGAIIGNIHDNPELLVGKSNLKERKYEND